MRWIRERVLRRELVSGTWLNLGSSMTAEIAAKAGFDWVVIDLEHGAGDHESCLQELQAVAAGSACPIVRVAWNEAPRFKRVLDLGAAGVVVPYVTSRAEAEQAVAATRYPPDGIRGAASLNRGADFGRDFGDYLVRANENVLTVLQIETEATLEVVDDIAAVDGADVLFVGPLDLSISLGVAQQFEHPKFREALKKIAEACRKHGKAAGILLNRPEQLQQTVDDGFTFIGLGSDGGTVAEGMRRLAESFTPYR